MSIVEFQGRFCDERACLDYLAASRWPDGFRCPGCGGGRAWVLERRHLWECGSCGRQTSVTAGTVLHGTHHLPADHNLRKPDKHEPCFATPHPP
jgi:hypothetical protein